MRVIEDVKMCHASMEYVKDHSVGEISPLEGGRGKGSLGDADS